MREACPPCERHVRLAPDMPPITENATRNGCPPGADERIQERGQKVHKGGWDPRYIGIRPCFGIPTGKLALACATRIGMRPAPIPCPEDTPRRGPGKPCPGYFRYSSR